MQKESYQFRLSSTFARSEGFPVYFRAAVFRETTKAVYLYGHGELDPTGHCVACGRELTHPGSILIGIGPDCLDNWGFREEVKEGMTEDQAEYLRSLVRDKRVDGWVPKAVIREREEAEPITVPGDHSMLQSRSSSATQSKQAQLVRYQNSGKQGIKITFGFDRDLVEKVKTLPGRRFHNEGPSKYWTCPLSIDAAEALREWGFELDEGLQDFLQQSKVSVEEQSEDIEIPGLQEELYPFQRQGVAFLEARNGRALLADQMGLGKTAQALAWLQLRQDVRPAIIVCPASLKLNWQKEAYKWMNAPNTQILSGTKASEPIIGEILIINYAILSNWLEALQAVSPEALILDEAHFIKNAQAKRTKATKRLAKGVPHVLALTGTPIVNRPIEGYNALKLVDETVVPSFWTYAKKFCAAYHDGFGWNFKGASNTQELSEKLNSTVMLRRRKEDVLKDLPPKSYAYTPFDISNRKQYDRASRDFVQWLAEQGHRDKAERASNAETLARIEGLKQLAVKGKLEQAKEWVENFLDSNGKLVLFATHKEVIDALMQTFGDRAVKVDGSISGPDREAAKDRFQNDDSFRLFVGNIQAAGTGLTLTAACDVAFLELPWSPSDLDQAADRCHRIGQEDSVTVWYLLASGTIEEEIAELIDYKRQVVDAVIDGQETDQSSMLTELIGKYKEVAE